MRFNNNNVELTGTERSSSLLLMMPPFPRLDEAWGAWGPSHVLVARTGSRRLTR